VLGSERGPAHCWTGSPTTCTSWKMNGESYRLQQSKHKRNLQPGAKSQLHPLAENTSRRWAVFRSGLNAVRTPDRRPRFRRHPPC